MVIGQFVSFGIGGMDVTAYNLVKGLLEVKDEEKLEIFVFYNNQSIPRFAPTMHDEGYEPPSRFENFKNLISSENFIKIDDVKDFNKYNLDILHTHRSGRDLALLPGFEKENFNFKVVETNSHGATITKADIRVLPSKALYDNVRTGNKIIIYNPIHPPTSNNDLRRQLGIEDKFVFGRVGRPDMSYYSGLNISAYKTLENDNNVMLYLAPCNAAKNNAKELGIKNIIFLEPTLDVIYLSEIYNTFDVLCHCNSNGETFGNIIAEGMLHNKPVVTSRGEQPIEVIVRLCRLAHRDLFGKYIELFTTTGVEEYANSMKKLENDKQFYDDVQKYLNDRANKLYHYKVVTQKYIEVYRSIT